VIQPHDSENGEPVFCRKKSGGGFRFPERGAHLPITGRAVNNSSLSCGKVVHSFLQKGPVKYADSIDLNMFYVTLYNKKLTLAN
jgi:hypothetical protein